jgi:hypothetical protein
MPDRVMNYIESEAPAELTLVQWRRAHIIAPSRRRLALGSFLPARRPAAPAL